MLTTYLRTNLVGLVGAARLSPEQTGKVGTAARPGNGDAVGQVAGEAGGWGRVEIGSTQQNRGNRGLGRPKILGWAAAHRGHPIEIHTRVVNMHF